MPACQANSEEPARLDREAEERAFLQALDEKDNARTTPPADERIWIPTIWVVEAFTPPLISRLQDGANRLGWNSNEYSINEDFLSKIGDMRLAAGYGGWVNLGHVAPHSQARNWPFMRQAPLPDGIKSLGAKLIQPFPSTTLLCCQFILDSRLSEAIQEPLRAKYQSRKEVIGSGRYRIWHVDHLKERDVQTAKAYLRSICAGWVQEYFPGHFSSEMGGREIPTYELVLFSKCNDFAFSSRRDEPEYLRMVGCQISGENWKCEGIENLYLSLDGGRGFSRTGTLFGNVHSVLNGVDLSHYGKEKEDQIIAWLGNLDRTFGTLAIGQLASSLIAEGGRLRDEFGAREIASEVTASIALWDLERRLSSFQRTALPFVSDIAIYCRNETFFLHDLFEFQQEITFGETTFRLFRDLRLQLISAGDRIREGEQQLRAIAAQAGRILSSIANEKVAKTNIRLQRQMLWLTIAMFVLTGVAAIEPIRKLLQ